MIRYFARVPASAVFLSHDGHRYAHVNLTVHALGVFETAEPRMLLADRAKVINGEAFIYIGALGSALAQRENLPFGVMFEEDPPLDSTEQADYERQLAKFSPPPSSTSEET